MQQDGRGKKTANLVWQAHCFASENQTYTGTVIFGIESLKSLKGQENLLLKNPALKTSDFCHGEHFL